MFVRGNCRYINKDDVNVKLQRTDQGWSCDFTTYRILLGDDPTLPVVAAQDYRGPYANADYWGKKPQPRFEDRTISLDEFSMDGPGRLSLTCLSTINPSVGALSDCKIAWYNQFVPESSNFHGVCGDKVSIPGFYVSTKKDR